MRLNHTVSAAASPSLSLSLSRSERADDDAPAEEDEEEADAEAEEEPEPGGLMHPKLRRDARSMRHHRRRGSLSRRADERMTQSLRALWSSMDTDARSSSEETRYARTAVMPASEPAAAAAPAAAPEVASAGVAAPPAYACRRGWLAWLSSSFSQDSDSRFDTSTPFWLRRTFVRASACGRERRRLLLELPALLRPVPEPAVETETEPPEEATELPIPALNLEPTALLDAPLSAAPVPGAF